MTTFLPLLFSVRPHLTEEEYLKTESIAKSFEAGIGKELNDKLHDKNKHSRNWVNVIQVMSNLSTTNHCGIG